MMPRARAALLMSMTVAGACTIAPMPPGPGIDGTLDAVPPAGYGTLRQDDVSMTLTSGELQIMVTPLSESVTRVTAPDTERRLSGLAEVHAPEPGISGEGLFLVSFFSNQADVPFVPEEVQFISRGLRVRPSAIFPVTPQWGTRRVEQQRTETAVYWFEDGVDLESSLTLVYQFEQSTQWDAILPRVQAERARARARAGTGPG